MSSSWPVYLRAERPEGTTLTLRALRRRDRREWVDLRSRNAHWLQPWEASNPDGGGSDLSFGAMVRALDRSARAGNLLPFVIDVDGHLVGQMHLFEVMWGSRRSATAGYWLDESATGKGIATLALALAIEHGLLEFGLHRVEVNVRPENTASLAVVQRLQLREEGLRRGLVYVAGQWRDHRSFAVTAEEVAHGTLVARAGAAGEAARDKSRPGPAIPPESHDSHEPH